MYRVYFSQEDVVGFEDFGDNDLVAALAAVTKHRDQLGHTFVTMVSGNVPGNVGKAGATPAGADYNWTKRRSTALRKDRNLTDEVEVPVDDE